MNPKIIIKKIKHSDRQWIRSIFNNFWGGDTVVTKGVIHRINDLDGFIATLNKEKVRLNTYKG